MKRNARIILIIWFSFVGPVLLGAVESVVIVHSNPVRICKLVQVCDLEERW